MTAPPPLARLALVGLGLAHLAGCGLRGDLERPAPLWGAERAAWERAEAERLQREAEEKARREREAAERAADPAPAPPPNPAPPAG